MDSQRRSLSLRSFWIEYQTPVKRNPEPQGDRFSVHHQQNWSRQAPSVRTASQRWKERHVHGEQFSPMSSALSWPGPRTVIVPRTDQGFGFTLRHFIVYPPESATDNLAEGEIFTDENDPEGRRVKRTKLSSLEPMDTIFVKHVKESGPAHLAGLNTGDRIVSVNGESVTGKTYSQVIALIQSSASALKLLVVPKHEDILQMAYQTSVYDQTQEMFHSDGGLISASQGSYVKVEHAGIAPTTEVTVTSRRGGWREELRRKYSTPLDETGYGCKPDRDIKSVSWQGSSGSPREPLRGDSRNSNGRKGSFDIRISYNYPSGKAQTNYSPSQKSADYGLYYPVVRKDLWAEPADTVSNQSRSNSNSMSSLSARQSQECVVQPLGSQEKLGQSQSSWTRSGTQDYPSLRLSQENMSYSRRSKDGALQSQEDVWSSPYSSARSHTWDSSKFASRTGKGASDSVPRSLTTSSLSKMRTKGMEYSPPDSTPLSSVGSNMKPVRYSVSSSTSNLPQNVSPTRLIQYAPPHTALSSQRSAKSTSADNLQNAGSLSVHRSSLGGQKSGYAVTGSRIKDYHEPNIPGRTFVVRIGDKVTVSPPSGPVTQTSCTNPVSMNNTCSFGTTFALTRAPSGKSFESRKNAQLPVSERKKQFEGTVRKEEVQQATASSGSYEMSTSTKRYKTEIEKLQSLGKIGDIVKRVQHFEVSNSSSSESGTPPPPNYSEKTPPPHEIHITTVPPMYSPTHRQQSQIGTRQQEQQQVPSPIPQQSPAQTQQQQQQQHPPVQQPAIKVRKISTERYQPPGSPSNSRPDSTGTNVPVRVCLPQSTSAPSSPTVEEAKGFEDAALRSGSKCLMDTNGMSTSMINPPLRMDSVEGTFLSTENVSSSSLNSNNRPTRKVSYLTAVNAPICKQEDLTILSSPQLIINGQNLDHQSVSTNDLDFVGHTVCSVSESHTEACATHKRSRSTFSFFSNATSGLLSAFSTLTAVMTASTENLNRAGCKSSEESMVAPGDGMVPPTSSGLKSASVPNVVMRKKAEVEDDGIKLHRRTSYLMATAKDRTTLTLPLDKSAPVSTEMPVSPSKGINIKKQKQRFGEKTPRIPEGNEGKRSSQDLNSPIHEVVKEGFLYCKTAITDGKRASDRSWKPMWATLKGHALYLVKDKKDGSWNPNDEQLISIKSCLVDIANDYTKKKNVFRLKTYNGSEYLLQADDQDAMSDWIQAIQTNNDPDGDEKGVVMSDFMLRKTTQYDQQVPSKTSPQAQQKSKKLSGLSFKGKMPYSPNVKRKKPLDDASRSKTWKGKFKSFRRLAGGASSAVEEEVVPTGTFGVPLELCVPSPENELVPLIVEICTKIVEARGLEVVGIYRVPGNTVSVHTMQDDLNRGFENMNSENDKWLDVNVISSLLKAFFRKLPEPLVTEDLYQSFINANRADDPMRRMLSLKRLLHDLPEHHFETFRHLAAHLKLVAMHEEYNKMDSRNLAIVFGPTLIRRKDEDMATLVKDMSDQCRIVESVIVNNEWFFSSWEEDNVVPVDDASIVSAPVSSSNSLLTRLAEDDRGKEINPKDIVSSIILAANKKLKGKDKKYSSLMSDDGDLDSECGPNERNIDQEVARRRAKSEEILTQDSASESTSTSSASKSFDQQDSVSMEHHDTYPFKLSSGAYSSERVPPLGTEEYMDWVFLRTHSDSQQRAATSNRPASLARHYSDDSLLDKNDELEISLGSLHNKCSYSRDRVDQLWRIELEARALREKEEMHQRESEKRRLEQQRIEQELARTKKELEIEDSHSLEDLLHTEFAMQISDFAVNRMSDLNGRGMGPQDSGLLLSEYSAMSSDRRDAGKFYSPKMGGACGSVARFGRPGRYEHEGGVSCHSGIGYGDRQGSMGKRAGSLETIIDVKCNNGKRSSGHHGKGKRDGDRGSGFKPLDQAEGKTVLLTRSSSVRRGSLDSLRDFYDKQDHRSSWASTDSEDGSDLLTSLTTTFDQKLQILLNPKFKLTGAAKRQLCASESTGSETTAEENKAEREVVFAQPSAVAIKPVPPLKVEEYTAPKPAPSKQFTDHSLVQRLSRLGESGFDRSFRDPSLHRMHKPDAKIGIASRFERGSSINSSSSIVNNEMSMSTSSLPSGSLGYRPLSSQRDKGDGVDTGQSSLKYAVGLLGSKSSQTEAGSAQKSSSGSARAEGKPFSLRAECRPITKSEKTEVNLSPVKTVTRGHIRGSETILFVGVICGKVQRLCGRSL
ncbi:uncharacterized protein LOC135477414 isoform X3 [Liolophura sinensis]|uniref:uncharacterized protein LOC135477414 isoform X3 n=1 Tax=Liolophura sinensis TaxID=3198878 RepID=UPI0031581CA6